MILPVIPFPSVLLSAFSFSDRSCPFLQRRIASDYNILCNLTDYITDIQDVSLT